MQFDVVLFFFCIKDKTNQSTPKKFVLSSKKIIMFLM